MDAIQCILTRRSIRKFTGEPVSDEQLHTILRAGFSAPTAANLRPWHFIVVRDAATIHEITKAHAHTAMMAQAGCGIIVCGDARRNAMEYFLAVDGSAAIENMLLAAHALGLGAVWLGLEPHEARAEAMHRLMNIPEHALPVGMFALGVPAEQRDAPDRYDETMVHYDKW
jgi:nitroreductase